MKMNYRLINNRRARRPLRAAKRFAALSLFLLLVLVFSARYPRLLADAAHAAARPLWMFEAYVAERLTDFAEFVRLKENLAADNRRLRGELMQENARLADYEALAAAYEELKKVANRGSSARNIVAAVLAAPPRSPYDTLALDAGVNEGISEGDTVFVGSVAVGLIRSVSARTSVAELFSTPGRKTPVVIMRRGAAVPVEAVGQGGGAFTAMLPREAGIERDDPVVMPGINPAFFAAVEAVEESPTDSFAKIYFKNPVSVDRQMFLSIRLSRQEP